MGNFKKHLEIAKEKLKVLKQMLRNMVNILATMNQDMTILTKIILSQ